MSNGPRQPSDDEAEAVESPGVDVVAELAGVSRATVSRAFSRPEAVNAVTRSKVLAVAQRVGYRPYGRSGRLATSQSRTIGLFVPDLANPYFPPLVKEVQARARLRDYVTMVADSDEHTESEEGIVLGLAARTDGLILASPRMPDETLRRVAAFSRTVLVARKLDGYGLSVTHSDAGITQAVELLAALGHRSVLYMSGPAGSRTNEVRSAALRRAGQASGLSVREIGPFEPRFEAGERAIDLVLAIRPTAVLAYNDVIALGLISQLRQRGITVGSDVSVIGIDDVLISRLATPPLTTIRIAVSESATLAVEMLLDQLSADHPAGAMPVEVPSRLVVRATTGPAPGRSD